MSLPAFTIMPASAAQLFSGLHLLASEFSVNWLAVELAAASRSPRDWGTLLVAVDEAGVVRGSTLARRTLGDRWQLWPPRLAGLVQPAADRLARELLAAVEERIAARGCRRAYAVVGWRATSAGGVSDGWGGTSVSGDPPAGHAAVISDRNLLATSGYMGSAEVRFLQWEVSRTCHQPAGLHTAALPVGHAPAGQVAHGGDSRGGGDSQTSGKEGREPLRWVGPRSLGAGWRDRFAAVVSQALPGIQETELADASAEELLAYWEAAGTRGWRLRWELGAQPGSGDVGCLLMARAPGGAYRIQFLGVVCHRRRKGWGRRLVARCQRLAVKEGNGRLNLEVDGANAPAGALYARCGFGEVARAEVVSKRLGEWLGES